MWLLTLLACPAEQLGIELGPTGAEAISLDDAQRDVRGLVREGPGFFRTRMGQMHFSVEEGEGWLCGVAGRGSPLTLVAPWPEDADSAVAGAVLIGVAKAWDTLGGPPGERRLCVGAPPSGPGRTILVERLAPGPIELGPPIRSGTPDPSRPVERLDFREVAEKGRAVFAAVGGA